LISLLQTGCFSLKTFPEIPYLFLLYIF